MLLENLQYSHTQTSTFCVCITRTVTIKKSFLLQCMMGSFQSTKHPWFPSFFVLVVTVVENHMQNLDVCVSMWYIWSKHCVHMLFIHFL